MSYNLNRGNHAQQPSDILEDRTDSNPVLTERLENWRQAVTIVLDYANQEYHTQTQTTHHLVKQRKTVHHVPNFSGASVAGGSELSSLPTPAVAGQHGVVASADANTPSASSGAGSHLSQAFNSLAQQTDILVRESESTAESIKSSVIPPLETLGADLEKHHKALKHQGQKSQKEIEKSREVTTKHLESLGRSVSTAGASTTKPEVKTDPYLLHRKVRSVAADQIQKENQQAESNLNTQQNFSSLEAHTIEVLQNAISQLDQLQRGFYSAGANGSQTIAQNFLNINASNEWAQFTTANHTSLVPATGGTRDPSRVTFSNSDHETTKPLIEGVLTRKGTVIKGNKHPGYYVLTPTGFLHEFKSGDYIEDPHPELSLYIPDSQIGGIHSGSGDLSFIVSSKDANKVLGSRHKYTFIASSNEELAAWHTALSRVAGATGVENLEGEEDEGYSLPGSNTPGAGAYSATGVPPAGASQFQQTPGTTPGFQSPTQSFTRDVPAQGFNNQGLNTQGLAGAPGYTGAQGLGAQGLTQDYSATQGLGSQGLGSQGLPGQNFSANQDITPSQSFSGANQDFSGAGQGFSGANQGAGLGGVAAAGALGGAGGPLGGAAALGGMAHHPTQSLEGGANRFASGEEQKFAGGLQQSPTHFTNQSHSQFANQSPARFGSQEPSSPGAAGLSRQASGIGAADLNRQSSGIGAGLQLQSSGLSTDLNRQVSGLGIEKPSQYGAAGAGAAGLGAAGATGPGSQHLGGSTSLSGSPSLGGTTDLNSQRFSGEQSYNPSNSGYAGNQGYSGSQGYSAKQGYSGTSPSLEQTQKFHTPQVGETSGTGSTFGTPMRNSALGNVGGVTGVGAASTASTYGVAPSSPYQESTLTRSLSRHQSPQVPSPQSPQIRQSPQLKQSGQQFATQSPQTANKARSQVPHYRISPSKQATLRSDHVDGLGSGGTFGGIPVKDEAEMEAMDQRDHDLDRGVLDNNGRFDWKKQDLQHEGHRHNAAEGLPLANEEPRTQQRYAADPNVSKPISAEPFAVVYPEVHRQETSATTSSSPVDLASEPRETAPELPTQPAIPAHTHTTVITSNYVEPMAVPRAVPHQAATHYESTRAYEPRVQQPQQQQRVVPQQQEPRSEPFGEIKPKDVPYSKPDASEVPEIAASQRNPLLGSTTTYGTPQRNNEFDNIKPKDVPYSTPHASEVPEIAASQRNPLLGSTTSYGAPDRNQNEFGNVQPRDVTYDGPSASQAPNIAAGQRNPLLGSNTSYGMASGATNLNDRDPIQHAGLRDVQPRDVSYDGPSPNAVPNIADAQRNPLLGSTTMYGQQQQPQPQQSQYASGGNGQGSNVSNIAAGQHNPLVGSTTSYASPTAGSYGQQSQQQQYGNYDNRSDLGSKGPRSGPVSDAYNTDTKSRLDPASSRYSSGPTTQTVHPETSTYSPTVGGASRTGAPEGTHSGFAEAQEIGYAKGQAQNPTANQQHQHQHHLHHQRNPSHEKEHHHNMFHHHHHENTSASGTDRYGSGSAAGTGSTSLSAGGAAAGAGTGAAVGAGSGSYQGSSSQYGSGSQQQYGSSSSRPQSQNYDSGSQQQNYGSQQQQSNYGSQQSNYSSQQSQGNNYGSQQQGSYGSGSQQQGSYGSGSQQGYGSGSQQGYGSQGGSGHQVGNYTSKDYSSYGPSSGGGAEAINGPASGAGQAKAVSGGSGGSSSGGKMAAAGGGLSAVAGLAGAAGVPGAGEASQIGQIGSQGIGGAMKSKIPGYNEANQAKQALNGDVGGLAKSKIPGAGEASQLNNTAKDLRGGKGVEMAEKEADHTSGGKVGLGKKIANVFK